MHKKHLSFSSCYVSSCFISVLIAVQNRRVLTFAIKDFFKKKFIAGDGEDLGRKKPEILFHQTES